MLKSEPSAGRQVLGKALNPLSSPSHRKRARSSREGALNFRSRLCSNILLTAKVDKQKRFNVKYYGVLKWDYVRPAIKGGLGANKFIVSVLSQSI